MNLIRSLLGLIISLTLLPICLNVFTYCSNISFDYDLLNDEIALWQLREQLLIAYDFDVGNNYLIFTYKTKEYSLSLVNGKMILQPGTQIYLNDIDDLFFENKNNCIYVCYKKGNVEYESVLCSQEGVRLNEFSDCDVFDNEHSISES